MTPNVGPVNRMTELISFTLLLQMLISAVSFFLCIRPQKIRFVNRCSCVIIKGLLVVDVHTFSGKITPTGIRFLFNFYFHFRKSVLDCLENFLNVPASFREVSKRSVNPFR